MKKVLISGASIAGPTIAYWLSKLNYNVTLVEREESIRLGGQNIDIKGAAKEVAEKMGIYDQIKQAGTGEVGTHYVDKDGNITATFDMGEFGGLTSELEILRGNLVEILFHLTKSKVHYRFADHITNVKNHEKDVEVTFHSGKVARYDLLIIAEGQRSKTRDLVFANQVDTKYLGLYTAYATIPKTSNDTSWAKWYVSNKSRSIIMRPDNQGTTRVALNFLSERDQYQDLSHQEKQRLLKEIFQDAGWESNRILDALGKVDNIYLDSLTQIKMDSWSEGRVVLLGDAGYCPTPLTGKGTALAMIGAYILAHELHAAKDHQIAFQQYENKFRGYVESVQNFPESFIKLAYPSSAFGVFIFNKIEGMIASKTFQSFTKFFNSDKSDEDDFKLPVYQD